MPDDPNFQDTMDSLNDTGGADPKKEKIAEIMAQFKAGTLIGPDGEVVKDRKQAMMIAMAEAEKMGQATPPM